MAEQYAPFPAKKLTKATTLAGLNTFISPFNMQDGEFLRLVNADTYPIFAKQKRSGLATLLGTADNAAIQRLFDWHQDDGTTFWLYRQSGGTLYYSTQGTGAWTICGNGTVTAGSPVGWAVLNNTLIIGDAVGSTRHTTNGTSFTNTTGAPIGGYFEEYHRRVFIAGTSNVLSWSVANDPTNWASTGTSDSSSIIVGGAGNFNGIMKVADRLVTSKNSGIMHRWDEANLVDLATSLGPSSFLSIGSVEDSKIYLNRRGYFVFDGNNPQIISRPIKGQIYNDSGSAIAGGSFTSVPGAVHRYNYYCAVGTVTDDITRETVSNCLQIYNYQLNEWSNYSIGTPITALWSYKDGSFNEQLIMGDNGGQCYTLSGTAMSDNGIPVETIMEYIYTGGLPEYEKKFNWGWWFFNPGAKAKIQVAVTDTFTKEKLKWRDLGDAKDGIVEHHFAGERGRLLFIKIIDSSTNSKFDFYGMSVSWDPQLK